MIFDSHLHVTLVGEKNTEGAVQKLLDSMKLVGVERSCVMPEPVSSLYFSKDDMTGQAAILDDIGQKHKDILYPLLWINPTLPFDFTKELIDRYIINGNIIGVKLWIEINARNKRLEPLAEYLEKHDIPVLFHSWYKTVSKYGAESDPSDIAVLSRKFPKLRILMAHLTGCRLRGVQDIKDCPNVWIDTSGGQPEDGYLEYAIAELGPNRVLFGSDYGGRDIATQLGRIFSVDMSDEDREKILSLNALEFYRKGERVNRHV
ncbi:MAG TPA: amidohydrolase family protein [Clostridiales bacterium]|nr:amidohydrolase family protein [Clostridiales bacterium]